MTDQMNLDLLSQLFAQIERAWLDDGSVSWLAATGLPVGIFPDSRYAEGMVQLRPGDRIVAYTDGVTEATNPKGEELGIEGLRLALSASSAQDAEELVRTIFDLMDDFSRGRQSDDATVLVLHVS